MPETFPSADGAWITCASDLEHNDVYPSFAQFSDDLDNQTDLEIFHEVEDDGFRVVHEQGTNSGGQRFFPFPFDTQDVTDWVYHFENDNSIRYEMRSDFEAVLDAPVYDDEVTPTADAESVCAEREDQILEFVDELLWGDRWIDLDGSDLLFMSPAGGPLPLSATHEWITPTVGGIERPFRPQWFQPTVAKLYSDGRLGLAWPTQIDIEESPEVTRPLPDLLVVDLVWRT